MSKSSNNIKELNRLRYDSANNRIDFNVDISTNNDLYNLNTHETIWREILTSRRAPLTTVPVPVDVDDSSDVRF